MHNNHYEYCFIHHTRLKHRTDNIICIGYSRGICSHNYSSLPHKLLSSSLFNPSKFHLFWNLWQKSGAAERNPQAFPRLRTISGTRLIYFSLCWTFHGILWARRNLCKELGEYVLLVNKHLKQSLLLLELHAS